MRHLKEPWTAHDDSLGKRFEVRAGDLLVAIVDYSGNPEFAITKEEAHDIALKIAAAPILLEACEEALARRLSTHHGDDKLLKVLSFAINKTKS